MTFQEIRDAIVLALGLPYHTDQINGVGQAVKELADTTEALPLGEDNTASNVGAGVGLFKQKVGVDLELKTLTEGTNIDFVVTDDEIQVNANLPPAPVKTFCLIDQTANQTNNLSVGDHVEFNQIVVQNGLIAVSGGAGQSKGKITLEAGKTYLVTARVRAKFSSSTGTASLQFRNNTGSVNIGKPCFCADMGANGNPVQTDALVIITTVAPTEIELRVLTANTLSEITALYTSVLIQEL